MGALLAASGCGDVSLDAVETSSVEATTSTGLVSTTAASSTSAADDGASTAAVPDLPPEPVGPCEPGCELELPRQWFWRGPSPELQHDVAGYRLSALALDYEGSVVVAERRGLLSWVTRLDPQGNEQWSTWLSLSCDCEVVALTSTEIGSINATAEGIFDVGIPVMATAALEISDGQQLWSDWLGLTQIADRKPRVGSAFLLGATYYGVLVIEPDYYGDLPQSETIEMYVFDAFGGIIDGRIIDRQAATDATGRPVGAADVTVPAGGPIVTAFPTFTGAAEEGYAVHLRPDDWTPTDAQPLPGRPLAAAATPSGRVLVASARSRSEHEVELHLAALARDLPVAWERVSIVESTAVHPAGIGLDPQGRPLVAMVSSSDAGEVRVELIGLELDGSGRFRETVVMPAGTSPDRLGFAVTEGGGIVLAVTVDDHAYVEEREPTCVCE